MYKAMLALHLLTAIFAIGPLVHLVTTAGKGIRNGDADATAASARSASIYTFVSTIVVIVGFGLMSAPSPWEADDTPTARFTEPFIWVSLILWLIAALVSLLLVVPTLEKATDRIRSGEAVADLTGRVAAGGGVIALLFTAIVVLMVYRPGS